VADWVCGRCKSLNRERSVTCYSCGGARGAIQLQPNTLAPRPPAPGPAATPDAAAGMGVGGGAASMAGGATTLGFEGATLGPGLGDGVGAAALADISPVEARPALPAGPEHLAGGVLGGAIGAALAAGLWYGVVVLTNWQIGLIAIAVGFVVGKGVVLGAGGRGSVLLIPVSVGLTFVSLVVSEYLIAVHFVNQIAAELGASAAEFLALFSPVDLVRLSLEGEPITLLFWAIAGYEAFIIPLRAMARGGSTEG